MAAAKSIKHLAGDVPSAKELSQEPPAVPLDPAALAQAVLQLQNTVNALIALFNVHTHTENTAASYTQNATTGAPSALITNTNVNAQTAQSLFTTS